MTSLNNKDPLLEYSDTTLMNSLLHHRPHLHQYISNALVGEGWQEQCVHLQHRPDSCFSTVSPGSGSSRRTISTGYAPSTIAIDATLQEASKTAATLHNSPLPLLGLETGGLYQAASVFGSLGRRRAPDFAAKLPSSDDGGCHTDEKSFFCTFCYEVGELKFFKAKSDWKRHEGRFHETGVEYRCPAPNCPKVFPRERDFVKHFSTQHAGEACPANVSFPLLAKYAYGCGFCGQALCKRSATTISWNDRCNHVAKCMQEGAKWSFTKTLLGLLKQPGVHDQWRKVRSHWCQQLGIERSVLEWHPQTSRILRQQLEYNDFGLDLHSFLENVFRLGTQDPEGHARLHAQSAQPAYNPLGPENGDDNTTLAQAMQFSPTFLSYPLLDEFPQSNSFDWNFTEEDNAMMTKRQNVAMLDALPEPARPSTFTSAYPAAPSHYQLPALYSINRTLPTVPPSPPADKAIADHSTASPGRRLLRKSKSWLSGRRINTDHPDLPHNYHLPGFGTRSSPSTNHNVYDVNRHGTFES
ncbi:hypothetical protein GQ43DRAFT_429534 [Delitschia confertaspora ATCC 74209]|uniref:C2H2-type domain-containing protein n=1 Tax=Delitschia confertaspora ATCC 74209 TaxID=1513339 RepID=A0A9P4JV78_9PLEO|nr:hypothetical protein GQ43DRAFT_429534 [Delitschia confertaspora ATCC 74209]